MNILLVILTIALIFCIAKLILKKYNTVFIFVATGIIVLTIITAIKGVSILPEPQSTGNIYLDVLEFVKKKMISNTAGLGIVLMTVTGYAMFMSHIGASTKLALKATKPLKKFNSPYFVLAIIFVIGCMLKLVITSHSGLGLLMVATTFPILLNLGVSRLSAGAVMCFTGFLDWGPNDSSAIFAAKLVNMEVMDYFLQYQGKVSLIVLAVSVIFIPIYYSRLDKKMKDSGMDLDKIKEIEDPDCPGYYAILPIIPLVLVAVFSFVDLIKMDVVTANLVSFVLAFLLEVIRHKDVKKAAAGTEVILKSMGTCFANIVSIVIAAAIFAEAIKQIGGVTIVANFLASLNGGLLITMFLMSLITFGAVILLGSGNASWYAFGPLVPGIAEQMGVSALWIALPMQLATAIGRSLSPVAGVVIAVAGLAEVTVEELIKHSVIPMVVAFIVNVIASYLILSICVIPAMIWFVAEFSSIGDKVLLQTPVYPPFHDLVKNNGRQLVYNEMKLIDGRYEIDFEDLEKKLKDPKVKIMFVCNPQNPTGRCFTKEELIKIGELCLANDVMIGVDEIHADIVFDGLEFIPFCSISEEFANNSVTFINPAKTFNVAGFRTAAWFTHSKKIYDKMINQQTYAKGMGRNIFGNEALMACYNYGDSYADQCVAYLNETRDQVVDYINKNIPGVYAIKPEATFMTWLDCRELGFKTQQELKDFMFKEAKILLNDGTTFGAKEGLGFMRFNFASPRHIVMEGVQRLEKAVKALKK